VVKATSRRQQRKRRAGGRRPTTGTSGKPRSTLARLEQPAPRASTVGRLSWASAAPALVLAAVALLSLLVVPLLGAVLGLALFIALVPTAPALGTRIVLAVLLLLGALALGTVLLSLADVRLTQRVAAMLAAGPWLAAAIVTLRRQWRSVLPVADAGAAVLLGTAAAAWAVTGGFFLGEPPDDVLGGLSRLGWDHQSHFSIFQTTYSLGGVWSPEVGGTEPFFASYPPLQGVLWTWWTLLAYGTDLSPDRLLGPAAQSAAVTAALSLGLLAWLANRAARQLAPAHATAASLAGGAATGGYVVLGPALSFFDYGFTNYLLAVALAAAASWFVLNRDASNPVLRAALVAAAAAAVTLLWTPLLLLLVPAAVALAYAVVTAHRWPAALATVGFGAVAFLVLVWQSTRLTPDAGAAYDLASVVGSVGGGHPPVPAAQGVALSLAAVGIALLATGARRRAGLALLSPAVGALALVVLFAVLALRTGTAPQTSYYVAKAGWAVHLVTVPVLGAAVGAAVALLQPVMGERKPRRTIGVAAAVLVAVVWSTLGYVSAPPNEVTTDPGGYLALPPLVQGAVMRHRVTGDQNLDGDLVVDADIALPTGGGPVPLLWDGGSLKQNRWLASLHGGLSAEQDVVYSSLPEPYAEPAVAALEQLLTARPTTSVAVAYFRPASEALLAPLAARLPGRVTLHRLG
jgi:hypothetical protein